MPARVEVVEHRAQRLEVLAAAHVATRPPRARPWSPRARTARRASGSSPAAGCRRRSSRRPRTRSSPSTCRAPEKPVMTTRSSDGCDRCAVGAAVRRSSRHAQLAPIGAMRRGRARAHRRARHVRPRGSPVDAGRVELARDLRRQPRHRLELLARWPRATASGEPKCVSSARLRAGPTPGSSSSSDCGHRPVAARAVVGDREAVRLVAHALQQLQLGRVVGEHAAARGGPGRKTSSIRLASETTATPRSRKPPQRLAGPAASWPLPPSITTRLGSAAKRRVVAPGRAARGRAGAPTARSARREHLAPSPRSRRTALARASRIVKRR